ncbi:MAG: hypothetical protein ACRC42_02045, partial [Mycoplasma sp.]
NIEYNKSSKNLKLKLSSTKNNPRVHIYVNKYIDNIPILDRDTDFKQTINSQPNVHWNRIKFSRWKNIFLNNKVLSEEIQYVLDRKQYERHLGNSWEKPSLLLKPQFIRDTDTSIREAKEEGEYSQADHNIQNDMCCDDDYRGYAGAGGNYSNLKVWMKRNFINEESKVELNWIPNEKGEVTVKCELDNNSIVDIVCIDSNSLFQDNFTLFDSTNTTEIKKRDWRMKSELKNEKHYCELRKIHFLNSADTANNKFKINDLTSIDFKIFDSIQKYSSLLQLIMPNEIKNQFEEFTFLTKFDEWNHLDKLEKLSKYFSHELNIYLYFHHHQFFIENVYSLIKFKIEKTFIDYFLLDDTEAINKYTSPELLKDLNAFEKCLLIYTIRKTNPNLAKAIAKDINKKIDEKQKAIKPNEIKKLFNIALNVKHVDGELEKIVEEAHSNASAAYCDRIPASKIMPCSYAIRGRANMTEKFGVMNCMIKCDSAMDTFSMPPEQSRAANVRNTLYQPKGKVKEYCETHYYNKINTQVSSTYLVNYIPLFGDLAEYWANNTDCVLNKGFSSTNILFNPVTLSDILFAMSILDLKEKTIQQAQNFIKDDGLGLTIECNTNSYILTKEINETKWTSDLNLIKNILIAQITTIKDRVIDDDNNEEQKEPTKFTINKAYTQKTVVTNISNKQIVCDLWLQIPEGALPISSEEYTKIETVNLKKFESTIFEQYFYFPLEGNFTQYPSSVSINDLVIAKSPIKHYEVLKSIK